MQHNEIIVCNDELVSWQFHWTTSYRPPFPNFYGPAFFESSIAGNWKVNFESFFSNDDESSKLMSHWNDDSFLLLSFRKSLHHTDTNNFGSSEDLISKNTKNSNWFEKKNSEKIDQGKQNFNIFASTFSKNCKNKFKNSDSDKMILLEWMKILKKILLSKSA